MANEVQTVPQRSEVAPEDTWDLSSLYANDEAWEKAFKTLDRKIAEVVKYRGTLARGPEVLAACLKAYFAADRLAERLGHYAFLQFSEDAGNAVSQERHGRLLSALSRFGQAVSFLSPEVLSMSKAKLQTYLNAREMKPYQLWLQRLVEEKPHTLSEKEEKLLAMQAEMSQTASSTFDQLTDVDMTFGTLRDHDGNTIELSHASYSALLHGPVRKVRKQAFHQYYKTFDAHKNTLAATYAGSVQNDVYYARARNFGSSLEASLFGARVPVAVYDNLVQAVRSRLPKLHEYYALRRRMMKLHDIHMYDTYVPIFADSEVNIPWEQGVEMVLQAVQPLGDDYVQILRRGLTEERWCDRYENRGKSSGAYSFGGFDGFPYILTNYKANMLESVFTLVHEAGHSMHTYFSVRKQPYQYHDYELFVAEVASTCNEQLLHQFLLDQTVDIQERRKLINRQIDAIRATLFRQTMFAEFEREIHTAAESGEALTLGLFRSVYARLLRDYFGPEFVLDDDLELECLRIPHFYRAFYVYQYATGISAAIALARRILSGGKKERDDYRKFLSGGCSQTPLELLKVAGVDMSTPEPVLSALDEFGDLVDALGQ